MPSNEDKRDMKSLVAWVDKPLHRKVNALTHSLDITVQDWLIELAEAELAKHTDADGNLVLRFDHK